MIALRYEPLRGVQDAASKVALRDIQAAIPNPIGSARSAIRVLVTLCDSTAPPAADPDVAWAALDVLAAGVPWNAVLVAER
jgi:hypothetical protein